MISKRFDVKINTIRLKRNKDLSEKDSNRIERKKDFIFTPQKTITEIPQFSRKDSIELQSNSDSLTDIISELNEIQSNFQRLEEMNDRGISNFLYQYNTLDPQKELIKNAEEEIFGTASGAISYSKYKELLALSNIIDELLIERTIQNGGLINAVA